MITKEKMRVFDHAGNAVTIDVTVVDDERDYAMLEEPPEPVITVLYDHGERAWIVSGDENADHKDFEEEWFHGSVESGLAEEVAIRYAKEWAKAVRGVWEEI